MIGFASAIRSATGGKAMETCDDNGPISITGSISRLNRSQKALFRPYWMGKYLTDQK